MAIEPTIQHKILVGKNFNESPLFEILMRKIFTNKQNSSKFPPPEFYAVWYAQKFKMILPQYYSGYSEESAIKRNRIRDLKSWDLYM